MLFTYLWVLFSQLQRFRTLSRFHFSQQNLIINDILRVKLFHMVIAVFNYQSGQDSVLNVKSEDYASCNTDSPYAKFSDGHTVFKLNQSGPHFFISGSKDNCLKNEKLTVIVLAERSKNTNQTTNASPPSPQSSSSSPSPTGQEGQSPTSDTNQTPSPVSEPPPPSAAASAFVSLAASAGAFMASVLVLSF